jgi:hypothetical protein
VVDDLTKFPSARWFVGAKLNFALNDPDYTKYKDADIPYTFSAKKVESAITNIVNDRPVTNCDALVNPGCLQHFEKSGS